MVLFFTSIGLTWKLVPLCSGLHNKNQDDRRKKQLHVCLKEKHEQQKNKYKNAYTISFYNLNSYLIFKLTVWAEFRVAVDCRGSPATVS